MLTVAGLKKFITHFIGDLSDSLPDDGSDEETSLINRAGRWLCTAHPWKFLERPETTLNFTEDEAYVDMPSDFSQLLNIQADGITEHFRLTTFEELMTMRTEAITPTGFIWWGALAQPEQTAQTSPLPVPRLELYPTPGADETDALRLWYRAAWRELTADTHYPALPAWIEPLFLEVIRAFAGGTDDHLSDEYSGRLGSQIYVRLEDLRQSTLWRDMLKQDGRIQPSYGPIRGGAVSAGPHLDYLGVAEDAVNPS